MDASLGRLPAGAAAAASEPGLRRIRLLIVDDSLVVRTILQRMLEARPEFEVVAAVGDVAQALSVLDRCRVDIILLDVQMPGTDGITALPSLLEKSSGARVLIVSSITAEGAAASVRAMTMGAADTLLKPGAGAFGNRFTDTLCERLVRIGSAPGMGEQRPAGAPPSWHQAADFKLKPPRNGPIDCIAVGSSTGGIHALSAFFRRIPPTVDAPVLVTQHLPGSFMGYFASQIRDIARRPAQVAEDGVALRRGTILVAPGDAHLCVIRIGDQLRVRLDRTPVPSGTMPSVDPMLASFGEAAGAASVGIMLSGMGRDGAQGAERFVAAGGELLAQDSASSVVWGMPGAVARAGLASLVAPAEQIADRVIARAEMAARRREERLWA